MNQRIVRYVPVAAAGRVERVSFATSAELRAFQKGLALVTAAPVRAFETKAEAEAAMRECKRCGTDTAGGFCTDVTCAFHDHRQDCPRGWEGHEHALQCDGYACTCGGRPEDEEDADG